MTGTADITVDVKQLQALEQARRWVGVLLDGFDVNQGLEVLSVLEDLTDEIREQLHSVSANQMSYAVGRRLEEAIDAAGLKAES